MGKITISVEVAPGTTAKTFDITDGNIGRMVEWIKTTYPGGATATNREALLAWAAWLMATTKRHVLDHETRSVTIPGFDVT